MSAPWFIPENTTLLQQLQMFRKRREHFAIVVDEYGTLQGVVTLEDILEEIVGDINDETDIQNLDTMGIRKTAKTAGWLTDRFPSATSTANSVGTSTMNAPLPLPAICWK